MWLYLKHKFTWYHWRYDRRRFKSHLGLCSCGWKSRVMRKSWKRKAIILWCGLSRKHQFEPWSPATTGPAGGSDKDFVSIGDVRQCGRCYKAETRR